MSINTTPIYMSSARRDQRGVVSITVTMILMVVLSLLVIGFAQVSRRNQRQAFDQQLSTQAFYAAESGINAARNAIKLAGVGAAVPAKNSCTTGTGVFASLDGKVKDDSGVTYSCLLINPAPNTLTFNNGSINDKSTVIPLNAATGELTSIRLVWYPSKANTMPDCPDSSLKAFTHKDSWACGYGVLRFDLVPITSSMSVNSVSDAAMSTFAVPTKGGNNTMAYAPGSGNDTKDVKCTNDQCELTITIAPGSASMYMRIRSIYLATEKLEISGATASGPVGLTGAQALIDSTGKAQDVLRRVQVRVPISGSNRNQASDYAIQTRDSLCKRFAVMSDFFSSEVDNGFAGPDNGGNRLCKTLLVSTPGGGGPVTPGGGGGTTNPPGGGGGGGGEGNADIGSCKSGCVPGGSDTTVKAKTWRRQFTNLSSNSAKVIGCEWNFGDGTKANDESCNYGDLIKHVYPEIDRCIHYKVTLRVFLDNGGQGYKETDTYAPHGDGTSSC
jgi:Tfp pilus assembly protein PilX